MNYQFILLATVFGAALAGVHRGNFIVGGDEVDITEYPFLASLEMNGKHVCGVVIIKKNIVLTAAFCEMGREVGRLTVRAGSRFIESGGTVVHVNSTIPHPKYSWRMQVHNIAILILNENLPINGDTISTIQLAKGQPEPGVEVATAGWGFQNYLGENSLTLRHIHLRVLLPLECQKSWQHPEPDSIICIGLGVTGRNACQADEGGPVVDENGFLVGISAGRYECERNALPSVASKIDYYSDWITKNIQA